MRWAKAVAPLLVAMLHLSTAVGDKNPCAGAILPQNNPPIALADFHTTGPVTTPLDGPSCFFTQSEIECSTWHAASPIRRQRCLQGSCGTGGGFGLQYVVRFEPKL